MLGFVVVDKPKGITSHGVVKEVRKLLPKGVKVGHCGTLDPLATGVLILSVGKATRLSEYLLKQDKCYEVEGVFGLFSPTYDADGEVKEAPCREIGKEELLKALSKFRGEIEQTPPPYSAVRVKGKRAYQLAREGKKVELPKRKVKIHSIELLEFNYPSFKLKVCCSSGTYVRSLIYDLGRKLGCSAIVKELRRTKVGKLDLERAVKLERLKEEGIVNFLIAPQEILPFRKLELKEEEADRFKKGAPVKLKVKDGTYSVLGKEKFLGIGEVKGGVLRPEKVLT
ncbi:tRNA pseudouridine(55) synthase TruB [Thermovibrio sp.]